MDLFSFFVERGEACPVHDTPLPFGSPGVDSSRCGLNGKFVDDQWIPSGLSTAFWQQSQKQSDQRGTISATVLYKSEALSFIETDCCLPNFPHGFWDFEFSPTFWEELWTEDTLVCPSTPEDAKVNQTPLEKPQNEGNFGQRFLRRIATVDDNACCDPYDDKKLKPVDQENKKLQSKRQPKRSRGVYKKQRTRRGAGLPKGLTVCLRTLLRQLLAGTGWIVDPSIGRDEACSLIKLLVGPELESQLQIDPPRGHEEDIYTEWRQAHYTAVLSEIMTFSTGTKIEREELANYISLRRGPYRVSVAFKALLRGRQWPPCLPTEECLRDFGCYRLGEATRKSIIEQCQEGIFDFDS